MAVQWQKYTHQGNQSLVQLYQDGLKRLNNKLALMYKAGVVPQGEVLDALRAEVTQLVAQRQVIIKLHLKRAAADSYHDVLHQAARLVNIPVQLTTFSEADAAAAIRKRPKDVPSFETLLRKHKQDSIQKTTLRAEQELSGVKTVKELKQAIKTALTADANSIMRFYNAEATRLVNNAAEMAFDAMTNPNKVISKLMDVAGVQLVKVWIHDSPKVPREYHRDVLHGSLPDRDGYWHQDGDKALSPGGFSRPENNMGCRCTIEVMTVAEYLAEFGRGSLQPWSYLPE